MQKKLSKNLLEINIYRKLQSKFNTSKLTAFLTQPSSLQCVLVIVN